MTTPEPTPSPSPRRFALVGAGSRARMYTTALASTHATHGRLVALCDTNQTRMRVHNDILERHDAGPVPTYAPEDFTAMLAKERVEEVVVCSVDSTHAHYIAAALRAGCDVITEKPMTADLAGCREILAARRDTGRRVTVAFNYRYNPVHRRVHELVRSGAVGEVTSVHFEWLLDLRHGADYFRRWHRDKGNSGGLLVHKASHHFDLVNWWLDTGPRTVFAWGDLVFYGEANGRRHGLAADYARAHGSPAAEDDPFAVHLADSPDFTVLYLDAEHEDGYRRDQNVFAPGVTIEDDMSVLVRYTSGAKLSYHLVAYAPWEGYRVAITGSEGRLELDVTEFSHTPREGDERFPVRGMPARKENTTSVLTLRRHWEPPATIPVTVGQGGHGGGDTLLLDTIFGVADEPRPDHEDGARALLTGLAANASIASGAPVSVDTLRAG